MVSMKKITEKNPRGAAAAEAEEGR